MHVTKRARLMAGAHRGLLSVRADATPPAAAQFAASIEAVNAAFAEFRATNDRRIAEIEKKGTADPVTLEKLAKVEASLAEHQAALDDANRKLAAVTVGGGGGSGETPEQRQHREAFGNLLKGRIEARATTYSDPDGGFLAPATLDTAISRVMSQQLAVRRMAQVMPIGTASYVKFKSLGGSSFRWVGEADLGTTARPESSTPQLARMEFVPGEMQAEPGATQQALEDMSTDPEAWLAGETALSFTEGEGAAFVSGDGVKKPRGFLSYTNVLNASYAWGSIGYTKTGGAAAFASSNPGDALISQIHSLKPGYRNGAQWLMNDLTVSAVRKFKDTTGQYLWQPSIVAGTPATLLGYPVETDDNMPDLGADAFPIAFANWAQAYLIVDRRGITVLRNPYRTPGMVLFTTTKRVGGGVQNFEAIKLLKCEA